jgi:hypothetical protein
MITILKVKRNPILGLKNRMNIVKKEIESFTHRIHKAEASMNSKADQETGCTTHLFTL